MLYHTVIYIIYMCCVARSFEGVFDEANFRFDWIYWK